MLHVCLDDFEANTTAAELLVGIGTIGLLGIEDGDGIGNNITRKMMVANDEINAILFGIGHLCHSFDTAVEGNDELHTRLARIVDALIRNPGALLLTVGHIEIDIAVQILKVGIDQRDRRRAIDVVVAIDHDTFLLCNRLVDASDCLLHTLHEERIVYLIQSRSEEAPRLLKGCNTPFHKQCGNGFINTQRRCKSLNSL